MRNAVINNLNAPDLRGDVGDLWENFAIAERMKRNHNQRLFPNSYFRRSHRKQEIDQLFIETAQGGQDIGGVEVS